jgi:hypothetical protein
LLSLSLSLSLSLCLFLLFAGKKSVRLIDEENAPRRRSFFLSFLRLPSVVVPPPFHTMSADSISFRPLSLGPMTTLGGPGRNPFASFAKGAGASLNPAGAAAAAPSSASAPREERKKKNPADIVSYDTEFLMGFAKVRKKTERDRERAHALSLLSRSLEREPAERKRSKSRSRQGHRLLPASTKRPRNVRRLNHRRLSPAFTRQLRLPLTRSGRRWQHRALIGAFALSDKNT